MATNTSSAAPSGDRGGVDATGKQRWHAPAVKRLDVDLTAGNQRNTNVDLGTGTGGTSHS